MNGGSTSNRTPPHRQLPRMILLIHESTLNPQLLKTSTAGFARGNAINVLRVHQGIRTRHAPIEESQDRENCVRSLRFDGPADKFLAQTICADGEVRHSNLRWALCCNRLPPESA